HFELRGDVRILLYAFFRTLRRKQLHIDHFIENLALLLVGEITDRPAAQQALQVNVIFHARDRRPIDGGDWRGGRRGCLLGRRGGGLLAFSARPYAHGESRQGGDTVPPCCQ